MYMMENIKRIRNLYMTASQYLQTLPDIMGKIALGVASFSWTCFEGSEQEDWKLQPNTQKLPVNSTTFTTVLLLSVFGGPLVLNHLILPIANNISLVFRQKKRRCYLRHELGQGFGALFLSRLSTNPAGFCYCCFYLFG